MIKFSLIVENITFIDSQDVLQIENQKEYLEALVSGLSDFKVGFAK